MLQPNDRDVLVTGQDLALLLPDIQWVQLVNRYNMAAVGEEYDEFDLSGEYQPFGRFQWH